MKNRVAVLGTAISALGFLAGWYITKLYDCPASVFCYNLITRVGEPLVYGMGALAIVFLVLLFMPQAYRAWSKFAIWYVPLAAVILIFLTPEQHGWINLQPSMEQTAQWLSGIYLLVSLTIVGWVHFRKP